MKKLVCECCGGNNIIKVSKEYYQCENCGIKYKNDDISNLLIDVVEETLTKNSPKLNDMLKSLTRYMGSNNWQSASNIAEEILKIDSDNPEALLYGGIAMGKVDPGSIGTTFVYALDALQSKRQRSENDDEFYGFVNAAIKAVFTVYKVGLQAITQRTYSNSLERNNQRSIQENIRHNEEEFRRSVTQGKQYYGRSTDSPTLLDSIFNVASARADAKAISERYLSIAMPKMTKFTKYLQELDWNRIDERGADGFAFFYCATLDISEFNSHSLADLEQRSESIQKTKDVLIDLKRRTKDEEVLRILNTKILECGKAQKTTEKLKKDPTYGLVPSNWTLLMYALIPGYGPIFGVVFTIMGYLGLKRNAKKLNTTVTPEAKKKALFQMLFCSALFLIELIIVLLSL